MSKQTATPKQAATTDVFDRLAGRADPDPVAPAVDDDAADAPDAADEPAGDPAPGTSRRRVIAVLAGVVVVAALGLSGFLGWQQIQAGQTAAAGQAALEAAKSYAVTLTTLNANDIDAHYAAALAGSTGQFRDEYSPGSAHLRQLLIDNNAVGNGVVLDAAIKSATRSRVEVLLFVDQSISNAVLSTPRVDRNRVQMTMELVDGRWLASNVEII